MAIRITVKEYGTQNEITLDSYQSGLFMNEIRRIRGTRFTIFLAELFALISKRVRPVKVRPDCEIIVDKNGKITVYLLHGESVLYEKGSRVNYQFYMGMLLKQWLGILI